jgi:plastocyanin
VSAKYWIPLLVVLVLGLALALGPDVSSAPDPKESISEGAAKEGAPADKVDAGGAKVKAVAAESAEVVQKAGGVPRKPVGVADTAEGIAKKEAVPAATGKVYPKLLPGMGAVAGKFRLAGKIPTPDVIKVPTSNRDHAACAPHVKSERLVLGPGNEIRDVFVSVAGYKPKTRPKPRALVLDNSQCSFKPHALAATRGSTLEITNSDAFLHNSHGMLTENFNVAVIKGAGNKRKLRKVGWTAIKCDIHPWMQAQLHVYDHDLFDVTNSAGQYEIRNIPPGEYEIEAWHEKVAFSFGTNPKKRVGKIVVEAGKTVQLDVELEAPAPLGAK